MKFILHRHFKRTLIGAFAATFLVFCLSACGGHRHHDYGAHMSAEQYAQKRDKMVEWATKKLDLNDDQKQRLSVVGDKLFEQRTALIGTTKDARAEIKALVSGNKFDTARAQAMVTEKTGVLNAKSPEVIAAVADFFNSLNAIQQQKVRDYMEGRGHWFGRG